MNFKVGFKIVVVVLITAFLTIMWLIWSHQYDVIQRGMEVSTM